MLEWEKHINVLPSFAYYYLLSGLHTVVIHV